MTVFEGWVKAYAPAETDQSIHMEWIKSSRTDRWCTDPKNGGIAAAVGHGQMRGVSR